MKYRIAVLFAALFLFALGFSGLGFRGVGVGLQSSPQPPGPSCDPNYLGWWEFEADEDPQPDESCNDNGMDMNDGGSSHPTFATNAYGKTYEDFDGLDDYAIIDDHNSIDGASGLNWECWFLYETEGIDAWNNVIQNPSNKFTLYINWTVVALSIRDSGNHDIADAYLAHGFSSGTWHHIAVTCTMETNAGSAKMYIDGKNVFSCAGNSAFTGWNSATNQYYVMCRNGGDRFNGGGIGVMRFKPGPVWADTDVTNTLYNGSKALYQP